MLLNYTKYPEAQFMIACLIISEPLITNLSWNALVMKPISHVHGYRIHQLTESHWSTYASVNLAHLVHIMASWMRGAKPLSKPMLEYYQFETYEQISVKS